MKYICTEEHSELKLIKGFRGTTVFSNSQPQADEVGSLSSRVLDVHYIQANTTKTQIVCHVKHGMEYWRLDIKNSLSKIVDEDVHLFKRGEISGYSPTLKIKLNSACV